MTEQQQIVWDYYMLQIAKTDYGCEVLNDPKARAKRAELIAQMNIELEELGFVRQ